MPLISFIIPVFNIKKFLPDAVNSILSQTFTDYEIILVDDKSTDGSTQMCEQYAHNNKQIKSIDLNKNNGPGLARNTGLSQTKGEYVFFLDGDDSIADDSLEPLSKLVQKLDCPDMILVDYDEIFGKAKPIEQKETFKPKTSIVSENEFLGIYLKKERVGFRAWEFLIKRSLLQLHNLKFGPTLIWEDNDFIMRCIFASQKIGISNMIFYQWRIRLSDSLTSNHARHWHQMIQSAVAMLIYSSKKTLTDNQRCWALSCVNSCLYEFEAISASVSYDEYFKHANIFSPFIKYQHLLNNYIRDGGILKILYDFGIPDGPVLHAKSQTKRLQEIASKIPTKRRLYGFPATRKCVRLIENLKSQRLTFHGLLDNDLNKQGLMLDSYPVFKPEIIPLCYNQNNNLFILISTASHRTGKILANQLKNYGLVENEHFLCTGFDEE